MYTAIQQYFLVSLPEYLPLTALQQYKTLQHKWPKSQEDRLVTFGFILFGFWNTAWCKCIWITNVKEQNTFLAEQILADNFFLFCRAIKWYKLKLISLIAKLSRIISE